jgi:Fe-S-cluster-containing hydrogenase component 2
LCERIGHCYAITMKDGRAVICADDCTGCSTCVDICKAGAISMKKGATWSPA